jgi:hypothetical protein
MWNDHCHRVSTHLQFIIIIIIIIIINLPSAAMVNETAYPAITYWKGIHNYLGKKEGNI